MQVFDPFHTPVSVDAPTAFQHDKMSVISMDVLQSLNPTQNQNSLRDQMQIATLHLNNVSTDHMSDPSGMSDPTGTDKGHYQSSIPHNDPMVVNHLDTNASTKNGDSEEQMDIGINAPNGKTQYIMSTTTCESPTPPSEGRGKHLAEMSLCDSAVDSDDFSIHSPISTDDSLPELSYCQLDSRFVKHYWNFSPQKRVQKEDMIDLVSSNLGLEDCMTVDDLSNDSASFEQQTHTIIHLHSSGPDSENNMLLDDLSNDSACFEQQTHAVIHLHSPGPGSENNTFPSIPHSEENLKLAFSRNDLDNEKKATDSPVMLSGDTLESLSDEKANTPCSSSEYIQSHTATNQSWWNAKSLMTHGGGHFEDDTALDLTAEEDHLSEQCNVMDESIDVQGSSESFPPLHFTFMDEFPPVCYKSRNDDINSQLDVKCNWGYLPDDSLHTSSSLTSSSSVHCHDTDAMTMLDDTSSTEVDGILNNNIISPSEGHKPDSRCSSNESGYYGYVPSFDFNSFNGNGPQNTTTELILPFDENNMTLHQ